MRSGLSGRSNSEPRRIEIETERVLSHQQTHYGVIDIGSNSIRLVVYDDLSRAPSPRFNEKSLVALGSGIDENGSFSEHIINRAVDAIVRLIDVARAMQVERIDILATEATRKANNGSQLIQAIEEQTGKKARILSGEEEAYFSALGVISGFFQPKGMIGDIGGGSLEVAEVLIDRVGERISSMPLGAIPVSARLKDDYASTKEWIDKVLSEQLPPLLVEPVFYAIGGGWRAIARIHIAMNEKPVKVVHGYELPADEVRDLAKKIAKMPPEEIANLPDVPSRRIHTLSASALVMSRVLRKLVPEKVIFSAYGLREGWLYDQLDEVERYRDPLLEAAQSIGLTTARVPRFSQALGEWTNDLFTGETQDDRRLRLAICALTDIAWREHEKVRAMSSFNRLLQFPFVGVTHAERAFIAAAIYARYGGKMGEVIQETCQDLLAPSDLRRAEILGRAMLVAHRFSASVPEILNHAKLQMDSDAVRLVILNDEGLPDREAVQARLQKLASAAGIDLAEITSVD